MANDNLSWRREKSHFLGGSSISNASAAGMDQLLTDLTMICLWREPKLEVSEKTRLSEDVTKVRITQGGGELDSQVLFCLLVRENPLGLG